VKEWVQQNYKLWEKAKIDEFLKLLCEKLGLAIQETSRRKGTPKKWQDEIELDDEEVRVELTDWIQKAKQCENPNVDLADETITLMPKLSNLSRESEDGGEEVLMEWIPPDIIPPQWILRSQFDPTKNKKIPWREVPTECRIELWMGKI